MPFGQYHPGEMRFTHYHDPYLDYPYLFYAPWWPAMNDVELRQEFKRQVAAIREWVYANVPAEGYQFMTNGRHFRAVMIADVNAALAFRLRWC